MKNENANMAIREITKNFGGSKEAELHDALLKLKAQIKAEMLEEMKKAVDNINTFYN